MTDELFPCDHCGGKWSFGFSQRLVGRPSAPERDFARLGNSSAPPMQDMEPRSPYDVPYAEEHPLDFLAKNAGSRTPLDPDRHRPVRGAGQGRRDLECKDAAAESHRGRSAQARQERNQRSRRCLPDRPPLEERR